MLASKQGSMPWSPARSMLDANAALLHPRAYKVPKEMALSVPFVRSLSRDRMSIRTPIFYPRSWERILPSPRRIVCSLCNSQASGCKR